MNCQRVREYLFAFLDNELDSALSIEVQRHLDHCSQCAQDAEIEREIGSRLVTQLVEGSEFPNFDLDALTREYQIPPRRSVRWLGIAAAILLPFFLVGVFVIDGSGSNADFARLLAHDFDEFIGKGRPIQIASDDADVVAQWIQRETRLDVELPNHENHRVKLVGARKCVIAGRTAAFTLYDLNGKDASIVVIPASADDLEGMDRIRVGKRVHWVDRLDGKTVMVCRRAKLAYAAVSTASEEELISLMQDQDH